MIEFLNLFNHKIFIIKFKISHENILFLSNNILQNKIIFYDT